MEGSCGEALPPVDRIWLRAAFPCWDELTWSRLLLTSLAHPPADAPSPAGCSCCQRGTSHSPKHTGTGAANVMGCKRWQLWSCSKTPSWELAKWSAAHRKSHTGKPFVIGCGLLFTLSFEPKLPYLKHEIEGKWTFRHAEFLSSLLPLVNR